MSTPGTPVPALVAACVKWVDLRPEVDRVITLREGKLVDR